MASNLGGKLAVLAAFEGLFDEVEVPSVQAGNVGVTIGGGGGGAWWTRRVQEGQGKLWG